MMRILFLATVVSASQISQSKVLALRGGMDLGPINSGNVGNFLKLAAGVTAAGAITEKYAGLGETSITGLFKGDVWTTNLIIAMVTGAASTVLYSVGESGFDAGQATALLWLASLLLKVKDAPSLDTILNNPVESAIAVVSALLTFA